jgi:hypothetical protein
LPALKKVVNESVGTQEGSFLKTGGFVFVVDEAHALTEGGAGILRGVPMATKTVDLTLEVLAPPDWFPQVSNVALRVVKGDPATFEVMFTTVGGFTGRLALSMLGLPGGVVATITPQVVAQNETATISIPTANLPVTVPVAQGGSGPIAIQLKADTV